MTLDLAKWAAEQTSKPWPEIDPADWQTEPPEPKLDVDLAWLLAMRMIVRDRVERMDRARALMRRAYDEWATARDEMLAACDFVDEEARDA